MIMNTKVAKSLANVEPLVKALNGTESTNESRSHYTNLQDQLIFQYIH